MEGQMAAVSGLYYCHDYVTIDEEGGLIETIDRQPWITDLKRRVQHYGYRYNYTQRRVEPDMFLGPLPQWAEELARRLHRDGYVAQVPDQLIINEYEPGQGISSHIDCVPCFGDTILSISLGSPCVMTFTQTQQDAQVAVLLEPRGLVVMQGEARHVWKHGIPPRKTDIYRGQRVERRRRLSLTFRNIIPAMASMPQP